MMAARATHLAVFSTVLFISSLFISSSSLRAMEFPGLPPDAASAIMESQHFRLENRTIGMSWKIAENSLRPDSITDPTTKKTIPGGKDVFAVVLADGRKISASDMKLLSLPCVEDLKGRSDAVGLADRHAGKCIVAQLASQDGILRIQWRAILRDGDNAIRQELVLHAVGKDLPLKEVVFAELSADDARTVGCVPGSPVVAGNWFLACESPLADNQGQLGNVRCSLPWNVPIKVGESFRCWSVVGCSPPGQMRRAFAYYVERERARPYRPFLHYNSWYDIAWADRKMTEAQCLAIIQYFASEFIEKRGGCLDSFVFDDGWDNNKTLWGFHAGFPNGFMPLRDAAAKHHSNIGVWLSPWGGYDPFKTERLHYGQTQGFETNGNGFALAGPRYYARFRDVCKQMIEKYGVNFFKFDGVGAGMDYEKLEAGYRADMAAMVRLCNELRCIRPDVYISLTTGTWPSPFWLWHGDSIWRNGEDSSFIGEGTLRQQWMNFRDATTQQMVVRRGPLFPLNSVMNQGILVAQLGNGARMGDDLKDVIDEFRMFFGSGTQLQELYMTPQRMTPPMWDALAESAAWSRNNAGTLVDTHWIGGDASKSEPYGYASWSPRKGIFCVRNPSSQPKTLTIKLADVFELPQGAPQRYTLKSPWKSDAALPATTVNVHAEYSLKLAPFEVRVVEASPSDCTE